MLTVVLDSPTPIAEQILRGVRQAIASGVLGPGDELPPVRQLAADLGVNLNTVARAYRGLEAAGLVATARGRGTRVTSDSETRAESVDEARVRLSGRVADAIADLRLASLDASEADALIRAQFARFYPGSDLKGRAT